MQEQMPDMNKPQNNIEQQVFDQMRQQSPPPQQATSSKQDNSQYNQLAAIIVDLDRRLRTLEERYNNLRQKLHSTDQNVIDSERTFSKEIRTINDESMELKRSVSDFSDRLLMFGSEMQNNAKSVDLKVLEKYLAMWDPANYVTRKELREYLKNHKIPLLNSENKEE